MAAGAVIPVAGGAVVPLLGAGALVCAVVPQCRDYVSDGVSGFAGYLRAQEESLTPKQRQQGAMEEVLTAERRGRDQDIAQKAREITGHDGELGSTEEAAELLADAAVSIASNVRSAASGQGLTGNQKDRIVSDANQAALRAEGAVRSLVGNGLSQAAANAPLSRIDNAKAIANDAHLDRVHGRL
jgi:hypothetical protein